MTENIGGVGYEELDSGGYKRHTCEWNAAFTWCGKPMRDMRRVPDPPDTSSVQACAKCAEREAEAAAAEE